MEEKTKEAVKQETKVKGKRHKIIKGIGIAILLILFLILIYEVGIQSDGFLDKSNPMTREEVISLLEKGKEYPNYYYSTSTKLFGIEINSSEITTQTYVKDNIQKTVVGGKTARWENYNTKERIYIMGEHEGRLYASVSTMTQKDMEENSKYNQAGFDYSVIADREHFDFDYKYLGKKNIEGRNYILVKVWNKDGSELFSTKFLIDEETGAITKRMDYMMLGILMVRVTSDRNLKIDCVTDQDVQRPDLTGYTILGNGQK